MSHSFPFRPISFLPRGWFSISSCMWIEWGWGRIPHCRLALWNIWAFLRKTEWEQQPRCHTVGPRTVLWKLIGKTCKSSGICGRNSTHTWLSWFQHISWRCFLEHINPQETDGYNKKGGYYSQVLVKMLRNENPHPLLMGMWNGTATVKTSQAVSQMAKHSDHMTQQFRS